MKNPNAAFDPYDHLSIPRDADAAEIRGAYRKRAKATHPDTSSGSPDEFSKTTRALAILTDHTRRARYDATGDASDQRLDNTLAELAEIIMSLFDAVCVEETKLGRDPIMTDIAAAMRQLCAKNLVLFREQRANTEKQIAKQRRFLGRFKARASSSASKSTLPPDLIDKLLENRITQAKDALRLGDLQIAKFERVAAALVEYDFLYDASESASTTSSATGQRTMYINIFDMLRQQ